MANLINIRPTKDSATSKEMDEAAKALGMSRNEMILKAIDLIRGLDVAFYKKLEAYSKKYKVSMAIAVQNTMIRLWAQDTAKAKAWEGYARPLDEFMQVGEEIIGAKELYQMVFEEVYEEETRRRFSELQRKIDLGESLESLDLEFYNDFKPIYTYTPKKRKQAEMEEQRFWKEEGFFEGEKEK